MIVIDKRQYEVQKFVNRKETSSYYTDEDGMKVVAMLLEKLNLKDGLTLMDPFMGAGVTISGVSKFVKPKKVIGIEINEEPYKLAQSIGKEKPKKNKTVIYQYNGTLNHLYSVNIHEITGFVDRNWLSLFKYDEAKKLSQFLEEWLKQGVLRYLKKGEIITGIQMYGPEFFFIPNKYWKIIKEDEKMVTISNGENNLEISKKYLIKCLRKPEYYNKTVYIDDPKFYILSIGDEPQGDLKKYIAWGLGQKIHALSFGEQWYKHVWKQIKTRNPYGHVFLHNKIDLDRHEILANYSNTPLCASKDFFIIKTNNPLIAMWYNSVVMKDFLKIFGRKISHSWIELLKEDYMQIPVPSDDVNMQMFMSYINKWEL